MTYRLAVPICRKGGCGEPAVEPATDVYAGEFLTSFRPVGTVDGEFCAEHAAEAKRARAEIGQPAQSRNSVHPGGRF